MRIFLDASVVLAACGCATGASRAVFDLAPENGWRLLVGEYVLREVEKNVRHRLPAAALTEWVRLRLMLAVVSDELTFDWPVVFPAVKDKPVLFTAAAVADVLLTLDRKDFGSLLDGEFYGLRVLKPGTWIAGERAEGRLRGKL